MENYFTGGSWEGLQFLLDIVLDFARIAILSLLMLSAGRAVYKWIGNKTPSAGSIIKEFLKPTLFGVLIFSFSYWTDFVGEFLYATPKFFEEQYEVKKQAFGFVDESGNTIPAWIKYQNVMFEYRELQRKQTRAGDNSWAVEQMQSTIIFIFDMLVEGLFFVIKLVIDKIQEAILSFVMATGVIALMFSYFPGFDKSFDKWMGYFIAVQLWSLTLVILKIFYDASIISEINRLESALAAGSIRDFRGFSYMINYIANCITYVLMFIMVPFLTTIFMEKGSGAEFLTKMVGLATAGTSVVASAGKGMMAGGGQLAGMAAKAGITPSGMMNLGNQLGSGIGRVFVSSLTNVGKN